jgi:hypothetical protein
VLSPQWQTPLHVGNVRHGDQRSAACVPFYSFSVPLPFTDCHDNCGSRLRGFTEHRVLLSVRDSRRPNQFPSLRFWLSFKNYPTWPPPLSSSTFSFLFTSLTKNAVFPLCLSDSSHCGASGRPLLGFTLPVVGIKLLSKSYRDSLLSAKKRHPAEPPRVEIFS